MTEKKIDFEKAKKAATELLEIHDIVEFPIDLLSIFEDYDNLRVITYKEIMDSCGITREQVIKNCKSTEGALSFNVNLDEYILAYNELITSKRPKEMIYWTLCHEFGHYILQHNKEKGVEMISRKVLQPNDRDPYETEANFFARFFLTPPSIIATANLDDAKKISSYFGVSYTSAKITRKYIVDSINKGIKFNVPEILKTCYSKFVKRISYGKTCVKCNSYFEIEKLHNCLICNGTVFNKLKKGDNPMAKYLSIEVDHKGRAKVCPRCQNEELDYEGNYCNVCSAYLVNECTDLYDDDPFGNQNLLVKSCGATLSGNARYCHKCGNPSAFLSNNYLNEWNHRTPISDDLPF